MVFLEVIFNSNFKRKPLHGRRVSCTRSLFFVLLMSSVKQFSRLLKLLPKMSMIGIFHFCTYTVYIFSYRKYPASWNIVKKNSGVEKCSEIFLECFAIY